MTAFEEHKQRWQERREKLGEGSVGRKGEDHIAQAQRITEVLQYWLTGSRDRFFDHGLDFGCGWGRLTSVVAEHCTHVWAADVFEDWVARAELTFPTVSGVVLTDARLPLASGSVNLIVDCMTLQDMEGQLLLDTTKELRRVAAPNAVILSLRNPKTPLHAPSRLSAMLGLASDYKDISVKGIDVAPEPYSILCGRRL